MKYHFAFDNPYVDRVYRSLLSRLKSPRVHDREQEYIKLINKILLKMSNPVPLDELEEKAIQFIFRKRDYVKKNRHKKSGTN